MPDGEKTDEQIAEQVQKGDIEAFGLLVKRYEEKLMRYASKFIFDTEDAKDILQNIFIKTYVNIRGFDARRKFSPWIYRIAHNEFINAIRKKSRTPTFSIFDVDVLFPHPISNDTLDDKINKEEIKKILERSLKDLKIKYREPLVLYYFEGMNYGEIADILKVPVSTVGVRLKRGREFLKKIMQNHERQK